MDGGTSLALQLDHRNSTDIDLFTHDEYSGDELFAFLRLKYNNAEVRFVKNSSLLCYINGIKVNFTRHDNPFVLPPLQEEGIRYLSKEDIAAINSMKLFGRSSA